jgi:hypothetical protein
MSQSQPRYITGKLRIDDECPRLRIDFSGGKARASARLDLA